MVPSSLSPHPRAPCPRLANTSSSLTRSWSTKVTVLVARTSGLTRYGSLWTPSTVTSRPPSVRPTSRSCLLLRMSSRSPAAVLLRQVVLSVVSSRWRTTLKSSASRKRPARPLSLASRCSTSCSTTVRQATTSACCSVASSTMMCVVGRSSASLVPLPRTRNSSHRSISCPRQKVAVTSPSSPATSPSSCLLYTSDAADDLLCVDLGGRRIIKKKKKKKKKKKEAK